MLFIGGGGDFGNMIGGLIGGIAGGLNLKFQNQKISSNQFSH